LKALSVYNSSKTVSDHNLAVHRQQQGTITQILLVPANGNDLSNIVVFYEQ